MASTTLRNVMIVSMLLSSLEITQLALAGDPDISSDFVVPPNVKSIDGNFFTYTGMRSVFSSNAIQPEGFKLSKASIVEFPAVTGQSVSYAVLQFPPRSTHPLHIHPRSAELLLLTSGTLDVGFVDTANKLFTQTLQAGDMFVFPKGLMHYKYNRAATPALAISAFGSASAETVSLPIALFNSSIDEKALAISFKTSVHVIRTLNAALNFKPVTVHN